MKRLTKYGNTSHENGVCCTHFMSRECLEVNGNCANGCKWEEEVWSKLAHYEDLEEQGLLLKLPCKVGDTIYSLDYRFECKHGGKCVAQYFYQCKRDELCEHEHGVWKVKERKFELPMVELMDKLMGRWWFTTKEEAEAKLKEKVEAKLKEMDGES